MHCPECGCMESVRCFRTTSHEDSSVERRRRCMACGCVFGTTEHVRRETVKKQEPPKPSTPATNEETDKVRASLAKKMKQAEKLGLTAKK